MAAPVPPRHSRVLQTAETIKRHIHSGYLTGDLPGESALAKQLGISRGTLRVAMQVLTDEEWISPAKSGHRRRTLKQPLTTPKLEPTPPPSSQSACQDKVIVTLSNAALNGLPTNDRLVQTRLNALCSDAGIKLRHKGLDLSHLKRPAHRLKEFILQNPADLYFLHLCSREVQQWFSRNKIPCIVLGSSWPELGLSSVDYDHKAIGLHAASTLSRLGHKHVGMFFPIPEKRGLQLFIEGFNQASTGIKLTISYQNDTPDGAIKALVALTSNKENRPTALILARVSHVLTASSALPSMRLRIPDDLSLLSLIHDDALLHIYPSVTGYGVPVDSLPRVASDLAVKKLTHPSIRLDQPCLITPELSMGKSLMSPR